MKVLDVLELTLESGEEGEGGTTVDYMIKFVRLDWECFKEWRLP